ncbi:hypothetical protein DFH09DRAFT_1376538 [Mycena vulgaris]|nr:hypothetical protein DFH09DRAFT_1376538 [Mycena vulgaris]
MPSARLLPLFLSSTSFSWAGNTYGTTYTRISSHANLVPRAQDTDCARRELIGGVSIVLVACPYAHAHSPHGPPSAQLSALALPHGSPCVLPRLLNLILLPSLSPILALPASLCPSTVALPLRTDRPISFSLCSPSTPSASHPILVLPPHSPALFLPSPVLYSFPIPPLLLLLFAIQPLLHRRHLRPPLRRGHDVTNGRADGCDPVAKPTSRPQPRGTTHGGAWMEHDATVSLDETTSPTTDAMEDSDERSAAVRILTPVSFLPADLTPTSTTRCGAGRGIERRCSRPRPHDRPLKLRMDASSKLRGRQQISTSATPTRSEAPGIGAISLDVKTPHPTTRSGAAYPKIQHAP